MAVIESWVKADLKRAVRVQYLQGNVFSSDNEGNLVGVEVYDNGQPATLSGSVSANVIRADGTTVVIASGTLSDNKASVILPQAAYAVPGVISVIIKLEDDSTVTTLAAVVSNVYRSSTDTIVDPGTIMPSIQTLITEIETAVASIPADYSSLWTTLAPAYSTSATYAVGDYVTYDGVMYRCISAITSGESWTAAHWSAAKIGPDLSDVKSAITDDYISLSSSDFTQGTWSGGSISVTSNRLCVKNLIPVKKGDIFKYNTSTLMIAFGTYEAGASASTDYHTWQTTSAETTYIIPVDGSFFVQIKKSDESNITPSDYTGVSTKIYNTINGRLLRLESDIDSVDEKTDDLKDDIYYTDDPDVSYVSGLINTSGNFTTRSSCKVTNPILLESGQTVNVKTKGDGSYIMTVIAKVSGPNIPISSGQSGGTAKKTQTSTSLTTYSYTASDDVEYIVCCVKVDETSEITFENTDKLITDKLQSEIDNMGSLRTPLIKDKYIMMFGDSLTAASTTGVVGFASLIASDAQLPYKAFVYDSADGSTSDVPQTSPCLVNYAKDGTTNRIVSGRTDSVVERVKRHITASTNIDYVLIECCVNDAAQSLANKGTISASYTAEYDTSTSIGSLEETIRYLTTLEKQIKVGCFIPWQVSWVSDSWFDDYIAVFEKWAVPYLDLRKTAGFDVKHCTAQSNIYTLTADDYSAYNNSTTYNLDDKVKYGGILYKCLANGTVGKLPTDTDYWMEVSSSSSDGTHLNTTGHAVVVGKIQDFILRL